MAVEREERLCLRRHSFEVDFAELERAAACGVTGCIVGVGDERACGDGDGDGDGCYCCCVAGDIVVDSVVVAAVLTLVLDHLHSLHSTGEGVPFFFNTLVEQVFF